MFGDDIFMKFAYKLQELRKGSGMSQEEFAELLGVSRQSVSKWESGKGYPEIDKLIFISNYFNTSLDLLLKDTSDYNSNPSINRSTSKKSSRKKKKSNSICLTKQNYINNSSKDNPTMYISDPVPKKNVKDYPLTTANVSKSSQLRKVNNYQFGSKKKKINVVKVAGVLLAICVGAILSTVGISISNSNDTYVETTMVVENDISYADNYEYNLYNYQWEELYDDEFELSEYEQSLLEDIDFESETILIDTNGGVYSSGYDVVCVYRDAQNDMRNTLNCMNLYSKYVSFDYYENSHFLEVYSYDLDEWIVINDRMLRIYPNQWDNDVSYQIPSQMYIDDFDILSSSVEDWKNYNNYPFENVFRINTQSYAVVSSDILDLCMSATEDRKDLNMSQYIRIYEEYNNKFELVEYSNSNLAFVPKDFIMVNILDIDNNQDEVISESVDEIGQVVINQDASVNINVAEENEITEDNEVIEE